MIEVEIRGALDEAGFHALKERMERDAELVERHEREMILLYGYPGYDHDPMARLTDIRLRKTNGNVEVMVKHKASANNVGRHELSLPIADGHWETAKSALKALGFSSGLWMDRKKDVYRLGRTEWSLVEAPDKHFYFEAEREAEEGEDLDALHRELEAEAAGLGLSVLGPDEMREFIYMLDRAVNKEIEW